jgi:uncharacterized protein (TIGR03437 family)
VIRFTWLLLLISSCAFAQGSPDIVISQVYGGGGNTGAPLRSDFIELFNRGKVAVSISGWSVQYSSANGSDWQVTPLTGTIEPGRYYLVEEAAGANTAAPALPDPDASGSIAMSGTAAKVALVRASAPLMGAVPVGSMLVDLVGYGAVTAFEKAPAAALTNTTAAIRRGNGCVDTDDNSADFQTGTPRPRNSSFSGVIACDAAPVEPTRLKISEIQGPGAESPVVGMYVTTRGIVTGRKSNGFFMQSTPEDDDDNPQTSEGIFVFTSAVPSAATAVATLVEVTGTVTEFRPASDLASPPITEIVEPAVQSIAPGHPLPAAVALSAALDLETLEGMRVSVPGLRVVGATGGTVSEPNATASSNGVFYAVEQDAVRPFASASGILGGRLLRVDSRALGRPALDVHAGDTTSALTGVLDFAFRTYTIAAESTPLVSSPSRTTGIVPRSTKEFAVTSMNLERLFDTEDDPRTSDPVVTPEAFRTRMARTARVIRETLGSPEIIGVVEVENLPVLQALARESGNYEAYLLEGNDIGGIDVGVLVRRDRVTVQSFAQEGKDTRIDNDILNDRPPVILRATVDGLPIVLVVNHLRSLINADSPVVARKRRNQAEFLRSLLGREAEEVLISVGDYNMDQYDALMRTIKAPGLVNLNDTLRPNEAYTYVFNGVTQALDHVLVSPAALRFLTRYQILHLNADFPESKRNDIAGVNRISDHDFPVAYFSTDQPLLRAAGITNAATYTSGSIAPSEWLTIFTPGPVTRVMAGEIPATIVSSTPTQTTIILPNLPLPGRQLIDPLLTVSLTVDSNTAVLPLTSSAPGIFTLAASGQGQGAILNQDLTVNGPANAATRGSILAIYGTGVNVDATTVWIGSTRAAVTYSGQAPGLRAGIQQINARIPADAPIGAHVPIVIAAGNEVSGGNVTVAIR